MDTPEVRAHERQARWIRWGWGLAALAAAAYLLVNGHGAQAVSDLRLLLPWLIVLSCPLMHIFGRGRHRQGAHHGGRRAIAQGLVAGGRVDAHR